MYCWEAAGPEVLDELEELDEPEVLSAQMPPFMHGFVSHGFVQVRPVDC